MFMAIRSLGKRGVVKKALQGVYPSPKGHWVGDGFPVRSLFSYDGLGQHLSPFLLLDYAGRRNSRLPRGRAAWVNTRTAASRR